tara:strand:- start:33 stop:374 length:342 start_codon:yes stop_codon:yes gene_type:complete
MGKAFSGSFGINNLKNSTINSSIHRFMNKKYILISFVFLASISLHSFADHHYHFSSTEQYTSECQACEENVEIEIPKTKSINVYLEISPKTNLTTRFVNSKNRSNLSRAPPSN